MSRGRRRRELEAGGAIVITVKLLLQLTPKDLGCKKKKTGPCPPVDAVLRLVVAEPAA